MYKNAVSYSIRYLYYGQNDGELRWAVKSGLGRSKMQLNWIYTQPNSECPEVSGNKWGYYANIDGKWIQKNNDEKIHVGCWEKGKHVISD